MRKHHAKMRGHGSCWRLLDVFLALPEPETEKPINAAPKKCAADEKENSERLFTRPGPISPCPYLFLFKVGAKENRICSAGIGFVAAPNPLPVKNGERGFPRHPRLLFRLTSMH